MIENCLIGDIETVSKPDSNSNSLLVDVNELSKSLNNIDFSNKTTDNSNNDKQQLDKEIDSINNNSNNNNKKLNNLDRKNIKFLHNSNHQNQKQFMQTIKSHHLQHQLYQTNQYFPFSYSPQQISSNPFYSTNNSHFQLNQTNQNHLLLNSSLNQSANYFYSTSLFNNNQTYQDHRNYLKCKKEQNMHKLWPHSIQSKKSNSQDEIVQTSSNDNEQINVEQVEAIDHNDIKDNNDSEQLARNDTDNNTDTDKTSNEKLDSKNEESNDKNQSISSNNSNKTPMCLINELVKFNKIKHEYVLLDEIGPAHKKKFFVSLKLGIGTDEEESYQANGTSIKKAQHSAAEQALKDTKFKKPISRAKLKQDLNSISKQITLVKNNNNLDSKINNLEWRTTNPKKPYPSAVLNSLCMKLGLRTNYEIIKQTSFYQPSYLNPLQYQFNKNFHLNQYNNNTNNRSFEMKLKLADQEFYAKGSNLQQAKHNVARKALEYLSYTENINKVKQFVLEMTSLKSNNEIKKDDNNQINHIENEKQEPKIKILTRLKSDDENKEDVKPDGSEIETNERSKQTQILTKQEELKSEISVLLEYGYRLKKPVTFELVQESGPSHIKKFVTKCSVGTRSDTSEHQPLEGENIETSSTNKQSSYFEVFGEGNSKKSSKLNSAIEMLKILKQNYDPSIFIKPQRTTNTKTKLNPQLNQQQNEVNNDNSTNNNNNTNNSNKNKSRKQKAKNIIKIKKSNPDYGKGSINPITRLIQIQQAKKEPEPAFELISSTNQFRKNDSSRSKHEFLISVTIKSTSGVPLKCEGRASTKKMAKQKAAELMLEKLGFPAKVSVQSNLKPVLKNTTSKIDNQDSSIEDIEKNEKRVKFVDDNLIKSDIDEKGELKKNSKKVNCSIQSNKISKMKKYNEQLVLTNQKLNLTNKSDIKINVLDEKQMNQVYQIAYELLKSVKSEKKEFYSPTAESFMQQKLNLENNQLSTGLSIKDFEDSTQENKNQFKILNNGNDLNYKGALDYLSNCLDFKCFYQSILGRDGIVNSYLRLSIQSETDKPFSGQGSTYLESSNLAALNALEYLSKQHK